MIFIIVCMGFGDTVTCSTCGFVRAKYHDGGSGEPRWHNYGDCNCKNKMATLQSIVQTLTPKIDELNKQYTEISKEKEEEQAKFNKMIAEKDAEKDEIIRNFQKQQDLEKESIKMLKITNEKLNDQCDLLREQNEKVVHALFVIAKKIGLFSDESETSIEDLLSITNKSNGDL